MAAASAAPVAATTEPEPSPQLRALMALLGKNMAGQWGDTTRVQTSAWAFWCSAPAEEAAAAADEDEGGSSSGVEVLTCLLCYGLRHRKLHPSFPRTGDHACEPSDEDVSTWLPPGIEDKVAAKVTDTVRYSGRNGNTSLKFHCQKYHAEELSAYEAIRSAAPPGASQLRPPLKRTYKKRGIEALDGSPAKEGARTGQPCTHNPPF